MFNSIKTTFVLSIVVLFSACSSTQQSVSAKTSQSTISAQEVNASINAAADWQLDNMDNFESYIPSFIHRTVEPVGWVQGTFYLGLSRWANKTNNVRYVDYLVDHGDQYQWRLGDRLYHADDHVVAQYYLELFQNDKNNKYIKNLITDFDKILSDKPTEPLDFEPKGKYQEEGYDHDCQKRWCWSDALFMSPPAWFGLSAMTGDPKYAEYADAEYRATTDYLFDQDSGFYYRDSRFFSKREDSGEKIFWSRGNGWVFAGLTSVIDSMPKEDARRNWYIELFQKMSKSLIAVQSNAGYWPVSLEAGHKYPVAETSGTAFFLSGLAWGVNNGTLNCEAYMPSVKKAWTALKSAQKSDGMLGYVQQVGFAPDRVSENETQLYGAGAFLLAGTELLTLIENRGLNCTD